MSNNVTFCCFMDFWVFLWAIPTFQQKIQIFLQNCTLKTTGLVNDEFFKPFYARRSLKNCTKNSLKNLKTLSFSKLWVMLMTFSNIHWAIFPEKRASDLVSSSRYFRSFYFTEIFQPQIKIIENVRNRQVLDIFEFSW